MTDEDDRMDRARRIREMREGGRQTDDQASGEDETARGEDETPRDENSEPSGEQSPTEESDTGVADAADADDTDGDSDDDNAGDGEEPDGTRRSEDDGSTDEGDRDGVTVPGADVSDVTVDPEELARAAGLADTGADDDSLAGDAESGASDGTETNAETQDGSDAETQRPDGADVDADALPGTEIESVGSEGMAIDSEDLAGTDVDPSDLVGTGVEATGLDGTGAEPGDLDGTDGGPGDLDGIDGDDAEFAAGPGGPAGSGAVQGQSAAVETRVLEFDLGTERYCLDIEHVEEIVKRETVTRVPNTPDYVEGVVDLRGQITTILDPKVLLDIDSEGSAELLVIFDPDDFEDQGAIGWVVDDVNQVTPIREDEVNDSPVDQDHVQGVVDRDGEFVIWTTPKVDIEDIAG